MRKRRPKLQSNLSDEEYQRFAEQFADMILDSRKPWVFQHLFYGGFRYVPSWENLNSGELALDVMETQRQGSALWESWLADALRQQDRQKLVPYFKKNAKKRRLTKDQLARLLEVGKPSVLRKSFKALANPFASHRGPKPKIPTEKYADALRTAELLKPAITKLLEVPKTSRTLIETLQYLQKDFPQACEFLLRHVNLLQQAMSDPGLRTRAKKRIAARARVLADAMAGAEYALSFRTSVERVGEARRATLRNSL